MVGCDNFNSYYDPGLKRARAKILEEQNIPLVSCDICQQGALEQLVEQHGISHLVHLAAQAGVRYSIDHPEKYQEANLDGFFHVLETVRRNPQIKLTFASSSSVYGLNKKVPFSESDMCDTPANFYGATKKCNELMAFAYHSVYGIRATGLRFFTVYGPWGRPDMAYYSFAKAIRAGTPIKLFNNGKMQRDFTYIDDIVDGIIAAVNLEASFEIFNLGNNRPEELMKLVALIEGHFGKKAKMELLPMPVGEIEKTFADIGKAKAILGWEPKLGLEEGMGRFLNWFNLQDLL